MKKDQRVVMITGSGQGLGRQLAVKFADKGWQLILHYRNSLPPVYESSNCFWVQGDMTRSDTLTKLVDSTINRKRVDVLINNCGIYHWRLNKAFSRNNLRRVMLVNFFVPVELTERLKKHVFDKQSNPCIVVNINSASGIDGALYEPEYSASKHALRGYFSSLKKDHSIKSMKIIDVFLGAMKTNMTEGRIDYDLLIDPKEVANAIFNACTHGVTSEITEFQIKRSIYDELPMR